MTTRSPEDLVRKLSAWRLYLDAISRQRKDRIAALSDAAEAAHARAQRICKEAEQARRRLDALSTPPAQTPTLQTPTPQEPPSQAPARPNPDKPGRSGAP